MAFVASHSNLSAFENCPKKFHHQYILKDLPREESEAMRWGNAVHTALENRCKSRTPLPTGMEPYEPFAKALDRHPFVKVEEMMGMGKGGGWTEFFSKDVWFRGKLDIVVMAAGDHRDPDWRDCTTAVIIDWKTGKKREDPSELLEHAVLLQAAMPQLDKITGHYVWLKTMEMGCRHELEPKKTLVRLKQQIGRIEDQLVKGVFPANPNPLCGFCPVKSCEHNKVGR